MERPLEYIGRKTVENIAFWGHFDLWPSVHSFHCRSSPRCSCWRTANRPRAQRSRVPFKSGQLKRQIKQSNKAKPPQYNHINNHHLLRRRRQQQQQQQQPHHPQLRMPTSRLLQRKISSAKRTPGASNRPKKWSIDPKNGDISESRTSKNPTNQIRSIFPWESLYIRCVRLVN